MSSIEIAMAFDGVDCDRYELVVNGETLDASIPGGATSVRFRVPADEEPVAVQLRSANENGVSPYLFKALSTRGYVVIFDEENNQRRIPIY